ncbi:MAG: outer membrane protein assembly factor BamA [Calditrichia bacterium]|nr:outer membrane protein assembly factor BamA [Calditrichia bacterium]
MVRFFKILLISTFLMGIGQAQHSEYYIGSIGVIGTNHVDRSQVLRISGLDKQDEITADGISQAIKDLWASGWFSDVKIYAIDPTKESIDLVIQVEENPRIAKLFISGYDELSKDQIKATFDTHYKMILTPYKLSKIKEKIEDLYISEGFLQAKVNTYTIPADSQLVNLIIDIDEGEEVEIGKISFHGNHAFEESDLKDEMEEIEEEGLWRSGKFSPVGYQRDLEKIIDFYRIHGYRDAEILSDSISYSDDKSEMYITIRIEEGTPYYISQIEFEGNTEFSDLELYQNLGFQENDRYNAEKIREAVNTRLLDAYYDLGYLFTNITPKEMPVARDSLKITFVVDEGKEVRVRNVSITGNTFTKEKVVRRELKVLPGDVFNKNAIRDSQRELMMTNYFSNAIPQIEPVDDEHVDVTFDVDEKITMMPNFSGGWSEQGGLMGGLGLRMNNFMGNGQSIGVNTNIGQYSKSGSFDIHEPWLFDKPISAGLSLYYSDQKENYSGFSQKSVGGALQMGHKLDWLDEYIRVDWTYRYDNTTLGNFSEGIIETNPNGLVSQRWPLTSSSIKQVVSRNTMDRPDFPTTGSNLFLSNEFAGGILGGNTDYHKHQLGGEWYTPLTEDLVFMANFQTGIINSFGDNPDIPYLQRFFLGGGLMSSSLPLRGYADPRSSQSYDRTGGTTVMKYGVELRYRILKAPLLYVLTFAEAGESWNNINQVNFGNLRRSAGFGIRVDVPYLGVIGVDAAYGFDTFNPVTGRTGGQWQFHIVVGNIFGPKY